MWDDSDFPFFGPFDLLGPSDGYSTYLLLLLSLLIFLHIYDEIPPVTMAVMTTHLIVHKHWWTVFNVKLIDICMNTLLVWNREEWYRIFVAPLYHANDYHIGYCLVSFFIKGTALEVYFGSYVFSMLIAMVAAVVNIMTIPVSFAFEYFWQDPSYISRCTIGFSGVVFALKVLTSTLYPHRLLFSWIELPIMCLLMPKLTSVANMSGVAAGLLLVLVLWQAERYRPHDHPYDLDSQFLQQRQLADQCVLQPKGRRCKNRCCRRPRSGYRHRGQYRHSSPGHESSCSHSSSN